MGNKVVLQFQHKDIKTHNEYWSINGDKIHYNSICPQNHPSICEGEISKFEALRQYALMTSDSERWEIVFQSKEWHEFVEKIKTA